MTDNIPVMPKKMETRLLSDRERDIVDTINQIIEVLEYHIEGHHDVKLWLDK